MIDGLWVVEFISTLNRYGKGILVLNKGRLLGGDSGFYYSGNYKISATKIEGKVNITRYDTNSISVFGEVDQFTINLSGTIDEHFFNAAASIDGYPQHQIKIQGTKREDI